MQIKEGRVKPLRTPWELIIYSADPTEIKHPGVLYRPSGMLKHDLISLHGEKRSHRLYPSPVFDFLFRCLCMELTVICDLIPC